MLSDDARQSLYGDRTALGIVEPYLIDADYKKHTMKTHLLAYMGIEQSDKKLKFSEKKFSKEQWDHIREARDANCDIRVFGAWRNDLEFLTQKFSFEIIERGSVFTRVSKTYNRFRNQFFKVKKIGADPKSFEIWVLVFPSKEYVDQVAELLAAVVQEINKHSKIRDCTTSIYVEHFENLERHLSDWTGFEEALTGFIWHGDVVAFGNIDDFGKGLAEGGFSQVGNLHLYGLNEMFGVRILHSKNHRSRLVLIGFVECFWGSAISIYATTLMNLGARHLLYGSKAATMDSVKKIHQVQSPVGFSLVESYDVSREPTRFDLTAKLDILCKIYGIHQTGMSVTVPTVMSESVAQREMLSNMGSVNMDCENGHIAKAVKSFNDANGFLGATDSRRARFVAAHFVTDYIYKPNDSQVGKYSLATGEAETLPEEKVPPRKVAIEIERKKAKIEAYVRIGHFFSNYLLLFGLPDLVPIIDRKPVQIQGTDEYKTHLKSVQHFLNLGQGVDAIRALEFQADQNAEKMKLGFLVALAVVSQKSGFVRSFYHYLEILDSELGLDSKLKFRINVLRLKMACQIGSRTEALETFQNLVGHDQFESASLEEQTSILRRGLLIGSDLKSGQAKLATKNIQVLPAEMHAKDKTTLFELIAKSYTLTSPIDTPVIENTRTLLSELRKRFFEQAPDSLEYFQTNPEKCAIACLFLEAGIDMQAEKRGFRDQGFKKLLLAHTMNLRNGGAETSETFGEILQSFKYVGIRDWIALAMRRDTQGRSIFKSAILNEHANSFENIGQCYGVFSAQSVDKEAAIQQGFRDAT